MKNKLTPLAMSLCLLSLIMTPAFAAKSNAGGGKSTPDKTNLSPSATTGNAGTDAIEGATDLPTSGPLYLPVDLDVPGQSFVSSGPYIGIPLEYSGSNLIINSPSVNEDITLLNIRKNINQRLAALGRPNDSLGSHILLSGLIEGQALYKTNGGHNNSSDIDLTTANLDAFIMGPSRWTSGFFEFSYDNNIGTQTGSFSSNDRTLNSRVYVNKAFVILGDFQQSPFYSSFGQMYVPFGVYSTTMVSSPLTKIMARTQARAIVVGYQQQTTNSLNVSTYIFHGPSGVSHEVNRINNGGVNIDYNFKMRHVNADMGVGVITNIADSQGMQFTGNNNNNPPLFGGFGGPTETFTDEFGIVQQIDTGDETLEHRVPAYDFHTILGVGDNLQFIGEYITASTNFSPEDMTYNDHGAKPQAWNLEAVYNMPWFEKPTSISAGYQRSKEALAIGLPAQRYSVVLNRSFFKNTLQSLEFRHDINYGSKATSTGSGVEGPSGGGKAVNMVTLQFDYYF